MGFHGVSLGLFRVLGFWVGFWGLRLKCFGLQDFRLSEGSGFFTKYNKQVHHRKCSNPPQSLNLRRQVQISAARQLHHGLLPGLTGAEPETLRV